MEGREVVCSIVVTNYNGMRWIEGCLDSIAAQTVSGCLETIFVDDCSNDGSVDLVKHRYQWARVFVNKENLGYCKSNNIGASHAMGRYILLLNNDTKLSENCLETLICYAEQNPDIGLLVSRQLAYDDGRSEDIGGKVDIFGNNGSENLSEEVKEVFTGLGACLFVRKNIWDDLGGFDEDYHAFAEDLDFFWRAHLFGYRVVAIPEASYFHVGGGSIQGGKKKGGRMEVSVKRRYFSERNKLTTMLKNYSSATLCWVIPLYIFSSLAEMLLVLVVYRSLDIVKEIYWDALQYNIKNLDSILKKRRVVQIKRRVSDIRILRMMEPPFGKVKAVFKAGFPQFK